MKRLIILVLTLFTVVIASGCENVPNSNMENHINTMSAMQTYVISVTSSKSDITYSDVSSSYIYVDNNNGTFLLSNEDREVVNINSDDVIFEFDNNVLYGYMFEDIWHKYEVDNNYLSIRNFESILFSFFKDATESISDEYTVYETYLNLSDLEGKMYNVTSHEMDKEFYGDDFLVTAYYSNIENRFTSFSFDLSDILVKMNKEIGTITTSEAEWKVNFTFEEINEDFSVSINDYVFDDYLNGFEHLDLFDFDQRFSYEMINGSMSYLHDQDVIKVEFKETGLYRLFLTNITSTKKLLITILDSNMDIFLEEEIDVTKTMSDYETYNEGVYYIVICVDDTEFNEIAYSFLFLGY